MTKKPFHKQKTFWIAIIGYVGVLLFSILNKILEFGFTSAELIGIVSSLSVMVTGYVGSEKFKDSKVIAKEIDAEVEKYGQPIFKIFDIVASKSDKGKKAVKEVKKIIEESDTLKKEFFKK